MLMKCLEIDGMVNVEMNKKGAGDLTLNYMICRSFSHQKGVCKTEAMGWVEAIINARLEWFKITGLSGLLRPLIL